MKIIAFAGSNSSKSINHSLVTYAASKLEVAEVIRLTDFDIPLFSIDIEENEGIPEGVKLLDSKLKEAKAFIISVSEHNGNVSAFFKNILDWLSRNNRNFLEGKKIVVLSTSPGKGGGSSALEITKKTLPYFGGNVAASLSVPSFFDHMKSGKLVDETMDNHLDKVLESIR